MPLVPMTELFERARREGYALGYFEAWDLYSLEAALEAAEAEESPVILGFGCMMADRDWLDQGGVEALGAMGRVVAERARVPVALLLNEAQTLDQALRGVESGFNAVMLDTSAWAWDDAVAQVSELTRAGACAWRRGGGRAGAAARLHRRRRRRFAGEPHRSRTGGARSWRRREWIAWPSRLATCIC